MSSKNAEKKCRQIENFCFGKLLKGNPEKWWWWMNLCFVSGKAFLGARLPFVKDFYGIGSNFGSLRVPSCAWWRSLICWGGPSLKFPPFLHLAFLCWLIWIFGLSEPFGSRWYSFQGGKKISALMAWKHIYFSLYLLAYIYSSPNFLPSLCNFRCTFHLSKPCTSYLLQLRTSPRWWGNCRNAPAEVLAPLQNSRTAWSSRTGTSAEYRWVWGCSCPWIFAVPLPSTFNWYFQWQFYWWEWWLLCGRPSTRRFKCIRGVAPGW